MYAKRARVNLFVKYIFLFSIMKDLFFYLLVVIERILKTLITFLMKNLYV